MNHESKTPAIESFKTDSIPKIVIKNSIPALIAMIMVMVYNLADTFFLGLTHDDLHRVTSKLRRYHSLQRFR